MFKKREARTPVRVTARMRVDDRWQDVSIRNVSSRGMMLSAEAPPPAGAYIEIRKQMMVVVARAVWVRDGFFGIRTQDRVDLDELLENAKAKPREWKPGEREERRTERRPEEVAERSRRFAARFQFAAAIGAVVLIAGWMALMLADFLGSALAPIRAALGG